MANLILLAAIILAGASFTSFTAMDASGAQNWATSLCYAAPPFCEYPRQMAYAAAGLAVLWLVMVFVSAVRD